MKTEQRKTITLDEVINALGTHTLADARKLLYRSKNVDLKLSGVVMKVVKRLGFMILLQIDTESSTRKMEAYAVFDNGYEIERAEKLKIKKGMLISVTGNFQSLGESAINLTNSRIVG